MPEERISIGKLAKIYMVPYRYGFVEVFESSAILFICVLESAHRLQLAAQIYALTFFDSL